MLDSVFKKRPTGIGYTFESLIGKSEDSSQLPDFFGIEIKTKRYNSRKSLSLFNAAPSGNNDFEIRRLYNNYGYLSPSNKNIKVLFASVYVNRITNIGINYKFKLKVDHIERKIFLLVFDRKNILIDKKCYWPFDALSEVLLKKINYLTIIMAKNKFINGIEYFFYDNIIFYKFKGFDYFIKLLESSHIKINFKVSTHIFGDKVGKLDNYGTSFHLDLNYLCSLFDIIWNPKWLHC